MVMILRTMNLDFVDIRDEILIGQEVQTKET